MDEWNEAIEAAARAVSNSRRLYNREYHAQVIRALKRKPAAWNQGMKCKACGEPMPNPVLFTGAANALSTTPSVRCKCGCDTFHGTVTL